MEKRINFSALLCCNSLSKQLNLLFGFVFLMLSTHCQWALGQGNQAQQSSGTFSVILCADGAVQTAGDNTFGQLGNSTNISSYTFITVPNLTNIVSVSQGSQFALAVKADGTVWAWGNNTFGQLGNNTTLASNVPVQVQGINNAIKVVAGYYHSMAILSDGTVKSWGGNLYGMLGTGNTNDALTPIIIPSLTNVINLAAGRNHSMALKSDGTVWAWGSNAQGQLGTGLSNLLPTQVNLPQAAISITSSQLSSYAILADCTAWAWGDNTYGQLGININASVGLPTQITGINDALQLSAGENFLLILRPNGAIWASGDNTNCQFGINTPSATILPIATLSLPNVINLHSEWYNTIATFQNGSIQVWGKNNFGQLGLGSTNSPICTPQTPITNCSVVASLPCPICQTIATDIITLACCEKNTAFLQFNSNNQVVPYGTGGTNNYTAPVTTATITPTSLNNPFGTNVGTALNPVRINGDINIPSGANITLSGFTFEFGINGRIKVATNAQLTITESTLRGNPNCQTMWQGIRVQGPGESNKRNLSGALNYGILQLTGVVNIEDAIIGAAGMYMPLIPPDVLLAQITQSQDLSTLSTFIMPAYTNNINAHQTSGGVVRVNGHVINFNNCFQGVNLSWYPYNGSGNTKSWVHQGNFIANRTLWYPFSQLPTAAGTISEVGVVLNYYSDLSINQSHFTNTLYGIRAFGAYKIAIETNNTFERTNFANKTMVGISVFNFQNSPVVDADLIITQNNFNNLTIGMQCAGADLDINTNTINNIAGSGSYAGALLYGCTYIAKSNNINHCYTGIASQSDQNIPNLIKANSFNNCLVPTWTRGDDTGLQIVCNDFDNYLTGICMSNATIVAPEPGKLDDQGSCYFTDPNPADNLFLSQASLTIPPAPPLFLPDLLSNTTDSYKYYYRTTGTDFQPTASANLEPTACYGVSESRSENCADFVLSPNDVINIAEGTAQDQAMIATIRRLVQIDHDTTAAVNLLATVNSRAAKRMALEYYIKKAMWNAAQQVLNSLSVVTQDEQFFKQLYTIKRDLAQSNRSIFDITTTEEATITNIAAYRTRTSFEAQAILYLVRQIEFPILMEHLPAPLPAYTGILPVVHFKNGENNLSDKEQIVQVYPNPTTGTVQFNVPAIYAQCQLTLYNIDGKPCLQQNLTSGNNSFALHNLSNGLYYYTIYYNGNLIQRSKLILVK